MTITEAIQLMRDAVGSPDECRMMNELADVWEEHEGMVACERCRYTPGWNPAYIGLADQSSVCLTCHGTGYVSNGNSLRAEALRLLAECGKVGEKSTTPKFDGGYWGQDVYDSYAGPPEDFTIDCVVSTKWADTANLGTVHVPLCPIAARIALMDAYAAADPATRERWARETRALMVKDVKCPECWGIGGSVEYRHEYGDCRTCHGRETVPTPQDATA